jgi:hypothetical protein
MSKGSGGPRPGGRGPGTAWTTMMKDAGSTKDLAKKRANELLQGQYCYLQASGRNGTMYRCKCHSECTDTINIHHNKNLKFDIMVDEARELDNLPRHPAATILPLAAAVPEPLVPGVKTQHGIHQAYKGLL